MLYNYVHIVRLLSEDHYIDTTVYIYSRGNRAFIPYTLGFLQAVSLLNPVVDQFIQPI